MLYGFTMIMIVLKKIVEQLVLLVDVLNEILRQILKLYYIDRILWKYQLVWHILQGILRWFDKCNNLLLFYSTLLTFL